MTEPAHLQLVSKKTASKVFNPEPTKSGLLLCAVEAREFARMTLVVSYICIAMGLPPTVRLLIDALIGASDGESYDELQFPDIQLALYCRTDGSIRPHARLNTLPECKPVSEKSLERWVMRTRQQLIKAQQEIGITLVTCIPGGRTRDGNKPSKYILHILETIREVQDILKTDSAFEVNHEKAIERAVKIVLEAERQRTQQPALIRRFNKSHQSADTYKRLVCTYFDKLARQCELKGKDLRPDTEDILDFIETRTAASREMGAWKSKTV
jgi:hypothetical protein